MAKASVDVLIIGAGAAGAAVAWSLAETRMRIVCLEQGGWMDPAQYPTTRPDWEMQGLGPFGFSPNGRGRREDYAVVPIQNRLNCLLLDRPQAAPAQPIDDLVLQGG